MSSSDTSSTTSGTNPYNFQSGVTDTSSQMPSTLGGLNSTSNLTGTGTSSTGTYYDPQSGQLFSLPTSTTGSTSSANLTQLQKSLAAGGKIASTGQSSSQTSTPRMMSSGKLTLPAESFNSGVSGANTTGTSSGVQNLLALMQQLKS